MPAQYTPTAWVEDQTKLGPTNMNKIEAGIAAASAVIPVVTTLPASPYDGQEVILVDSLTAPTYFWRFRYTASITDAYKWLMVGGPPVSAQGAGAFSYSSTTYIDATGGPTFTLPRTGYYHFQLDAQILPPVIASEWSMIAVKIGAAIANDNEAILATGGAATNSGSMFQHPSAQFVRFVQAGDLIKLQGRSATGGPASADRMHLSALPARVA